MNLLKKEAYDPRYLKYNDCGILRAVQMLVAWQKLLYCGANEDCSANKCIKQTYGGIIGSGWACRESRAPDGLAGALRGESAWWTGDAVARLWLPQLQWATGSRHGASRTLKLELELGHLRWYRLVYLRQRSRWELCSAAMVNGEVGGTVDWGRLDVSSAWKVKI